MFLTQIFAYMKYMLSRICFTFSSVLLFFGFSFSQGVAIGQWREHLPYNSVVSVVDQGSIVYAATPYSLFMYNKEDFSLYRYSKVNKLSDIGISKIAWHQPDQTLIIAYTNGNIDLLREGFIQNISDIKRSSIQGSKKINNIYIEGDIIYFSCDFGIVLFDIDRTEVKDTWFIGPDGEHIPVYDMDFLNDSIFAGTSLGIFKAAVNSPNLADYNYWSLDSALLRSGYYFNLVESFQDMLIINITKDVWDTDTSFYYKDGQWQIVTQFSNSLKGQFRAMGNSFVLVQSGSLVIYNDSLQPVNYIWSFNDHFLEPNDFAQDKNDANTWWIGDNSVGLIRNNNVWNTEFIQPQGPYTRNVYGLASGPGTIIGVPGSRDISWNNEFQPGGFYIFKDEGWTSRNYKNSEAMDTIWDILAAAVDPQNSSRVYLGAYGRGVIEVVNAQVTNVFDQNNTPIGGTVGLVNDVRVAGLTFDRNNNLWITTSYTNQCITVKTAQNQWYSYSLPVVSGTDVISTIIVDQYGNKWMAMPKGGGLLVFNENGTFANTADDSYKRLTNSIGNGNLPSMNVYSVAEDKDGRIWVGTDHGVVVFYYPQNIFTGQDFDAQQILVEVGGYVQPLMESETVNCIVVDGANRKWIGTEKGGVFLLSADGIEEVYHFTTDNSPILSNSIGSIAIVPETGEVFFGTYEGLISFKSTATEGPEVYEDSVLVYAYPNPVRPDYTGMIAVKNLVYNSYVKITDIYGNLIFETRALGGQAVWDGKLPDGTKPYTGVFLVFATNTDGEETLVTKILFVH
jgi:hypothetical protein